MYKINPSSPALLCISGTHPSPGCMKFASEARNKLNQVPVVLYFVLWEEYGPMAEMIWDQELACINVQNFFDFLLFCGIVLGVH